jgi:hypothetical protein
MGGVLRRDRIDPRRPHPGDTGKPTAASLILTMIGPTVITLWLVVIGVLLWCRSASAPEA